MYKKILRLKHFLTTLLIYKLIFKKIGISSVIESPLKLMGCKSIKIGNHVSVSYNCWLAAVSIRKDKDASIIIQDNVTIGHFNHIYATDSIIIEKGVLTADKVYISDNTHSYEDIKTWIVNQPIKSIGKISIGEGSWIGENVCVLGASIGKHCVIGSNSVVTHNIPDYSVAVGAPAKVIKTYDKKFNKWIKVE